MSIKVRAAGAWHLVVKVSVYAAGAWREVQRIQSYTLNKADGTIGWREIYKKTGTTPPPPPPPAPAPPPPPPPVSLSVTISPTYAYGSRHGPGNVFTDPVTASTSGGSGPYTYSWEAIYWNGGSPPAAAMPNSATTYFSQADVGNGQVIDAQFKVTAVDSLGNTGAAFIDVTFQAYTLGGSGGGGGPLEP
jgi:hypothetical protein